MKKIGILLTFLILGIKSQQVNAQDFNTNAYAFKQNERLGKGVNIIGYDPIWNNMSEARMQAKHFRLIKEAGFDNVRIKISPFRFSMDSLYTIGPKFFKTLDWAVQQALDNNLMPIIDFHEHNTIQKDPIGTRPMFLAMWKQIAEYCKDYPNDVLFEIANEPNMKPETWNEMHREAHKIIRASNPNRTLIVGTINGNQIQYLKDLELPENDRNIIVAIHYYSAIQFTHQGAPWSTKNKDLSGITWTNTEKEENDVIADFNTAQEWSKEHNRPLILGEFGAYEKADMASRARWTNFIVTQAEVRGWSWSYWQFDKDFILYNIDKDRWVTEIKNALVPTEKKVNTVTGEIDANTMGVTLTHEHIMSNFGLEIDKTNHYNEEAALKQIIPYLKKLKPLGVETIFDCTTAFFGRRTDLLKKISDRTGINIITNTGYYGAADDRYIPKKAYDLTAEDIAEHWIGEFENGIDGSQIKPGVIKLAFDDGEPSEIDLKLFEAGILTHKKTGLTLAVHTGNNPKVLSEELQLLEKHGIDPSALVWVHANKSANTQLMLELAPKGVWISLDGVDEKNTEKYMDRLTLFKANGLLHKVLLSHDGNSYPRGGDIRPYDAIPSILVPALKNEGFSLEEINQLLITNPKEAFAVQIRTKH